MLKYVLAILGWIFSLSSGLNILIKLFGSDDAVLAYAGSSRNMDVASLGFAISLIFLGISKILFKLEDLDERLDSLDQDAQ